MTEPLYENAFDLLDITTTDRPVDEPIFDFDNEGPTVEEMGLREPVNDTVYDKPDAGYLNTPRKPRGAAAYEKKVTSILNTGIRLTVGREDMQADAAAMLMYGPEISKQMGLLAVHDAKIARALDWMDEGISNPYLAVIAALAPLVTQVIRNHEPVLEPKPREFTLPLGKKKRTFKIPGKFGIKLGLIRNATHDPDAFRTAVLDDPAVLAKLKAMGLVG